MYLSMTAEYVSTLLYQLDNVAERIKCVYLFTVNIYTVVPAWLYGSMFNVWNSTDSCFFVTFSPWPQLLVTSTSPNTTTLAPSPVTSTGANLTLEVAIPDCLSCCRSASSGGGKWLQWVWHKEKQRTQCLIVQRTLVQGAWMENQAKKTVGEYTTHVLT